MKRCPACSSTDHLKAHSHYTKYHYGNPILILVLKCTHCGKQHAIIPSFSLPGTSLGTAEVESFIKNRAGGQSRRSAGQGLIDAGISFKHLKYIEKMIHCCSRRLKAIFAQIEYTSGQGRDSCHDLPNTENADNSIYQLNTFCLDRGVNAVFCNRVNILFFQKIKPGSIASNDLGAVTVPASGIDSS